MKKNLHTSDKKTLYPNWDELKKKHEEFWKRLEEQEKDGVTAPPKNWREVFVQLYNLNEFSNALKIILFQEAKKICKPVGKKEMDILRSLASGTVYRIEISTILPQDAIDYVVNRFKRFPKSKTKAPDVDLSKDEFLVSEVATSVRKNARTVQLWITDGYGPEKIKLHQEHNHAKIKKSHLLKFLSKVPKLRHILSDFQHDNFVRITSAELEVPSIKPAAKAAKTKRS